LPVISTPALLFLAERMTTFDFDKIIDRRDGDSIKWNRYAGRDMLPMWVADMDFAAPPAVLDALHRRIDHGVFGYSAPWPSLIDAIRDHLLQHYDWQVEPAWIVWIPGMVAALNVVCRAVGHEGDAVFTHTPVYPPFLTAPGLSSRRLATDTLSRNELRWQFDFAATDTVLGSSTAKLWLLCHPHNPVGRAWNEDELHEVARLAAKHDLTLCSDEIHCGLTLDAQARHRPFGSLSADAAQRSITLMAPSKTFNLPGLYSTFAVIPNPALRRAFEKTMNGIMPHVNTLGLVATEVAYRDCDDWRQALLAYLRGNAQMVQDAVAQMPGLATTPVEATYLAWIDCRELCARRGIDNPQLFFENAGVGLSSGADFGLRGDFAQYVRLNFGFPRSTLKEALRRMAVAIQP
jgi:cystathionine beta-lyase